MNQGSVALSRPAPGARLVTMLIAVVFHPWVRCEGPGSGFESSFGVGGGAPKDWRGFGPPHGIGLDEHPCVQSLKHIADRQSQRRGLRPGLFVLNVQDPSRYWCHENHQSG